MGPKDQFSPTAAPDAEGWVERRAEPRVAVNAPARLFYGRGQALWLDCLVKDRSRNGAKIQVPHLYELTSQLVLLDYHQGFAFSAELRWRKADMAGLRLKGIHDFNDPNETIERHLQGAHEAWLALGPGVRRAV